MFSKIAGEFFCIFISSRCKIPKGEYQYLCISLHVVLYKKTNAFNFNIILQHWKYSVHILTEKKRGVNLTPPCGFSKNVFFREMVNSSFL